MIKRTFDITARIEQGQIPFCFQCVQNDKDVYVLRIRITDGDKEIDYTQVSSATITFALANGAVVQSALERLSISPAGITYQMGTSEIACPGKVLASIQLFGGSGERLTTARFQFEVVADLITPGAVQSESRFPILQQLLADVEQLKQDIVNLQIPNGSIMDVKLSDAAGQIKQRFASHMADHVADADGVHGLKIEAGTFTPTVIGSTTPGTQTYSAAWGQYKKIDNMVYFQLYVSLSAKDAAMAGNVLIGGLPFTPATKSYGVRGVSIGRTAGIDTTKTGVLSVNGTIVSNEPFIRMYFIVNGATSTTQEYFTVSEIIEPFGIGISGFYEV